MPPEILHSPFSQDMEVDDATEDVIYIYVSFFLIVYLTVLTVLLFLFISYKSSVHMFWANLNVLFCFSLTMKNHRRTRAPRSRPNLLQMKNPVSKQTRMRNYPSGELARQSGSGLGHVIWKSDSGSSRERLEWRPRIHGSTSKESTRMVESLRGPCYSYVSMKYFKSLIIVDTTVKLFCILENKDLSFCKKIVSFLINYELQ